MTNFYVRKGIFTLLVILTLILGLSTSAFAVEKVYVKVNLTVKFDGNTLQNGNSLQNVKPGDKFTLKASCSDQGAIDWSTNTNYMNDKGYKFNREGMAKIGYVFDSTDSSKYTTLPSPTEGTVTVPNFAPGSEHYVVFNAVAANDGLVEDGKEIQATSGTFAIRFFMQEQQETKVTETITKKNNKAEIKATVTDGTFTKHVYKWDNGAEQTSTSNPVTVDIPTTEGKHTLTATAYTKEGKTDSATYNVEIKLEKLDLTLVKEGSNAKATATVTNGNFSKFVYHWDSEGDKTSTNNPLTVALPTSVGTHTLYVTAYASGGSTKQATLKHVVEAPAEETVTLSLKDSGSDVKATATVTNGTFDHYVYHWDTDSAKNQTSNSFAYPSAAGQHILYVKAVTKSGKTSTEQNITITVKEEEVTGTISASVPSGTLSENEKKPTEVKEGTEVTAKFNPESNFTKFEYNWDDEAFKDLPSNKKITVPNFEPGTTHKLTIRGTLKDGKVITKVYYITIPKEDDGKPDEGGELDIDPWMVVNNDGEGLVVALRNASDENKANKNYYMIDEEVIYKVDYKNFGKEINNEVKLVLNVPLKFDIIDADGGSVDSSKKTITWTYPYGLVKDAEDTKEVRLKYKELSKSSYKSEMIYPQAVIYNKSKAVDYSSVINCIYLDEDTKFNDTHEPYMYGDLEAPTFRPDEGISRAEGAMVLLRIFGVNYTNVKNITTKYSDIEDTYYVARQAITKATELKVMSGYPDGSFKPNGKMTRAEFMRVIASYIEESAEKKGLEVKSSDAVVIYKDKSHWSNPYVTLLARLNMTNASSKEKDLRVDDTITRAEVAQLCNFYLFRAPAKVTSSTNMQFTDVSRSHKLVADIVEATRASHSYTVSEDGKEVASK